MKFDPLELFYNTSNMSPLSFDFDRLTAPPMFSMIPQSIDPYIYGIATHPRYNSQPIRKFEMMDLAFGDYGFDNLGRGTNRCVYSYKLNETLVLKAGYDKSGVRDAPRELNNQNHIKPFISKTFEVSYTGAIGEFERVIPFTYKDEFISVAEDIFDVLFRYIIGKYILADIGTDYFMNWGLRKGFGPVLIDYPFMYELDHRKLRCVNMISTPMYGMVKCNGEIDYDNGFNHLICRQCGKQYFASDLAKETKYGEMQIRSGFLGGDTMARLTIDGKPLRKEDVKEIVGFKTKNNVSGVFVEESLNMKPRSIGKVFSNDSTPKVHSFKDGDNVGNNENHKAYLFRRIKKISKDIFFNQKVYNDKNLYAAIWGMVSILNVINNNDLFDDVDNVANLYFTSIKEEISNDIQRSKEKRQQQENNQQQAKPQQNQQSKQQTQAVNQRQVKPAQEQKTVQQVVTQQPKAEEKPQTTNKPFFNPYDTQAEAKPVVQNQASTSADIQKEVFNTFVGDPSYNPETAGVIESKVHELLNAVGDGSIQNQQAFAEHLKAETERLKAETEQMQAQQSEENNKAQEFIQENNLDGQNVASSEENEIYAGVEEMHKEDAELNAAQKDILSSVESLNKVAEVGSVVAEANKGMSPATNEGLQRINKINNSKPIKTPNGGKFNF